MPRGRRALPDEVKALKGNPGKRRLILQQGDSDSGPVKPPSYVTSVMEKEIFRRVAAQLSSVRFIKATDSDALARWAVWMAKWVDIKKRLSAKRADVYYETKSKHGKMLRAHPLYASMIQIDKQLMALEDRIGLNPTSRQAILRGLINAPSLPNGSLFGDDVEKPQAPSMSAADRKEVAANLDGALGFLKPH
jgi:P27 family predicted phage terminase small subunit